MQIYLDLTNRLVETDSSQYLSRLEGLPPNADVDSIFIHDDDEVSFTYFDPDSDGGTHYYAGWTSDNGIPVTLI